MHPTPSSRWMRNPPTLLNTRMRMLCRMRLRMRLPPAPATRMPLPPATATRQLLRAPRARSRYCR